MKQHLRTGALALAGGVGFLTRIPIGRDGAAWNTFRQSPWSWPIVAIPIGAAVAVVLTFPLPAFPLAVLAVAWLYLLTGITHLDGLADIGDAAAVHGDQKRRNVARTDPTIGVGGAIGISVVLLWLVAMLHTAITMLPVITALLVVITAEVSAKLAMATAACLSSPPHQGMGAAVLESNSARALLGPVVVSLPVVVIGWPHPAPALALLAGPVGALGLARWATVRLGGVSGDVLGAANELGRCLALGVGVIGWIAI